MKTIKLDLTYVTPFLNQSVESYQDDVNRLHRALHDKTGKGNDFLGWLDLPNRIDQTEIKKIIEASQKIQSDSEVLVVIGIGGSYLGAKAGLSFLEVPFQASKTKIIYAGHQMSTDYLVALKDYLKSRSFSINVISKSGTTTEPAIAFRILKALLIEKYGEEEAYRRIYATTDANRGAIYKQALEFGYSRFVIPDNVGGRFSVLTPAGLLPLCVGGVDIHSLLKGAKDAYEAYLTPDLRLNEAYHYAVLRHMMYQKGKKIEILGNYDPALTYLSEWWKQLFGESEGKEHKGLFVASTSFSTDLHSLGQYIQEGERHLFETILYVNESNKRLVMTKEAQDLDELNYLDGKTLDDVNYQAMVGTMMAHVEGEVPNILIRLPKKDAHTLGFLFYFFEKACAMSAYLLDVNPFNQPGVEAYKRNMFKLLGKKGY